MIFLHLHFLVFKLHTHPYALPLVFHLYVYLLFNLKCYLHMYFAYCIIAKKYKRKIVYYKKIVMEKHNNIQKLEQNFHF